MWAKWLIILKKFVLRLQSLPWINIRSQSWTQRSVIGRKFLINVEFTCIFEIGNNCWVNFLGFSVDFGRGDWILREYLIFWSNFLIRFIFFIFIIISFNIYWFLLLLHNLYEQILLDCFTKYSFKQIVLPFFLDILSLLFDNNFLEAILLAIIVELIE